MNNIKTIFMTDLFLKEIHTKEYKYVNVKVVKWK